MFKYVESEAVGKMNFEWSKEKWIEFLSGSAWLKTAVNGSQNGRAAGSKTAAAEVIGRSSYALYHS